MFLALREFKHARLRYALVSAVITMVAALVFILSGLANGLATGNSEAIDVINADGFVVASGSEYLLDRSNLTPDMLAAVQKTEGITDAQPLSATPGNVRDGDSKDLIGVSIIAVPPDSFLNPSVDSGDRLSSQPDGVIIDKSLANKGVGLGDTLTFDPSGLQLKVVGVTSNHQYRLAPTLHISIDNLAKVKPDTKDVYGAIAVRGSADAVQGLPSHIDNIIVGNNSDLVQGLPGYKEQNLTLDMIQIFLIVIAAGIIAAFFFILTLQKMSELGVMKALGATTWELAKALIVQSFILGVIGVLVGIAVGCTVQILAEGVVPFSLQWAQMIFVGALILLVAVVGTLLSLVRIARVDPLDAINKVG